jgi:hypothetical protein
LQLPEYNEWDFRFLNVLVVVVVVVVEDASNLREVEIDDDDEHRDVRFRILFPLQSLKFRYMGVDAVSTTTFFNDR